MRYGYIRVSSKSQRDNSSLKEQREAVVKAGAEEVVENMNMAGARNLSLAKAFKNASEADPFSFKSKDLPVYAQNIIRSYYA